MSSIKSVIVVGGTGNLGAPILDALLASKAFTLSALSRVQSKAKFPEGVEVVKTDYSPESLEQALSGQDAIVCVIGGSGLDLQKPIIEAASKVGVKRFIPAEYSSNMMRDATVQLVPPFAVKREIIDLLKSKTKLGLTWTGLATGPQLDWGLETGFLGFDIENSSALVWDGGNKRFAATNLGTLSRAIVAILKNSAESANQYLYIESATVTQNGLIDILEKQTGKRWTRKPVTTAEQVALGHKLLAEGDFSGALLLVQAAAWGNTPDIGSDFEREEKLANKLLGVPTDSVEDTVKEVFQRGNFTGYLLRQD